MILPTLFWTISGFLLGSIPFSPLIGRLALRKDIQQVGDQNPGATNVLRSGGFLWFSLALFLDISKGALPVGLAYQVFNMQGWAAVPIALAPSLGHAFSPFLGWRGGKAIAATFGVWVGLTIWTMPLLSLVSLIIFSLLLTPSGWAVMLTLGVMLVALVFGVQDPVQGLEGNALDESHHPQIHHQRNAEQHCHPDEMKGLGRRPGPGTVEYLLLKHCSPARNVGCRLFHSDFRVIDLTT